MIEKGKKCQSWQGKNLDAKILYSRAGVAQHIWISNENGSILFDTGDGVLRDILANNLDISQIKGIVFTHGHFDHVGGLHSLLGFLRMIERKEPLTIFAPKGCREAFSIADNFMRCYRDTTPFKLSCKEIQSNEIFQIFRLLKRNYKRHHNHNEYKDFCIDRIYLDEHTPSCMSNHYDENLKPNQIELNGKYTRGMTVCDHRHLRGTDPENDLDHKTSMPRRGQAPNCAVGLELNVKAFFSLLYDTIRSY